jgi:Ca-activated chloride channel family protein
MLALAVTCMSPLWRILIMVVVVAAVSAPAVSQSPAVQPPAFTSQAELVVVHVTVKDRRGSHVAALPREAFYVTEDGTAQRIDFFTGEDSPITVGFLVDSSGSMREGRERVIAATTAFVESSNTRDEIFALAFNEHVRAALPPSLPFTSDATVLRAALVRTIGAQGLTAMFDAVSNGLAYVARGSHPRRVLVVVGDGGDNASTMNFEQVLRAAQRSNAAIYAVGILDPLDREANPGLLKRLARAPGGEAFLPRRIEEIDDVLREIAHDIRNSYTLGYVSSNSARDGQFRRIRVVVTDASGRSLRVRARDGYRAGDAAVD